MSVDFEYKDKYGVYDLQKVVAILRAPGGCPWDAEQDHSTIRRALLEEAYEAAEAIDNEDAGELCGELGDVLLQVVFHAQIESEKNGFTLDDVADSSVKKMIERHPHVFSDISVASSEEVLDNWDKIKMRERSQKTQTEVLKSVSAAFPALIRAEKVYKKAVKADASLKQENPGAAVSGKLSAYLSALSVGKAEKELGDLLFEICKSAVSSGAASEEALENSVNSFIASFAEKENLSTQTVG